MIKLDHVVYFTGKSPTEIVHEQEALGWHTVIGGSHEKWGTYNALMYVNNAYIEWLSVEHEEVAIASNHQLVKQLVNDLGDIDKWGTICLSVEDINQFNKTLKESGIETSGVLDAERKTIKGELLKWKMLFVKQQPSPDLPLPFFIEWESSAPTRYQQLKQDGALVEDNEELEITSCIFNVFNPDKEAAKWASLLNLKVKEGPTIQLANTVLVFRKKEFESGKQRLVDVVIEHEKDM